MASFISGAALSALWASYDNLFDTFSRTIIVYKEPNKTPATQSTNLFGFGENQASQSYTYAPVTGVFQAKVKYSEEDALLLEQTNVYIPVHPVTIRVRQNCKNFIDQGNTEKIQVDGRMYKLDGEAVQNSFLSSPYWMYKLRAMK